MISLQSSLSWRSCARSWRESGPGNTRKTCGSWSCRRYSRISATAVERLKNHLEKERKPEAKQVGEFLTTLDAFFHKLEKEKDTNAVGILRDFQGGMLAALPEKIAFLKESLNASPVTEADIPTELRKRFVGKNGKYLLQVAPKHEIFDLAPLKAFIDDVRTVDPRATGEPVMVYESMTIMRDAYIRAFIYAFIAIVVILLITFRSVVYAVVGLVPLVVGVLFMVAGMWLCGINFNSANIIVMPLVLGIAVDSGIYLINRFRRERCSRRGSGDQQHRAGSVSEYTDHHGELWGADGGAPPGGIQHRRSHVAGDGGLPGCVCYSPSGCTDAGGQTAPIKVHLRRSSRRVTLNVALPRLAPHSLSRLAAGAFLEAVRFFKPFHYTRRVPWLRE